jgi:hypothetical protein
MSVFLKTESYENNQASLIDPACYPSCISRMHVCPESFPRVLEKEQHILRSLSHGEKQKVFFGKVSQAVTQE